MIRDWVEFNMTPGIGPRAAAKLLERFGSAEAVYKATRAELEHLRLPPETVDNIVSRYLRSRADAEIEAVGLGADRPLVKPDDTPAKKARNRRYEVRVRL